MTRVLRSRSFAVTALLCLVLASLGVMTTACHKGWEEQRQDMVKVQIEGRGVGDPRVLAAMREVPRHLFVLPDSQGDAYKDVSVAIGAGQTTPQPYIVALMAELLEVEPGDRVLEIGTGSGYQAAVLAAMGVDVFTIEIQAGLCATARETLQRLDYDLVRVRCGDGYGGWPEEAPLDGVVVTAASENIPDPLFDQLREGARMVIPVGQTLIQELKVITRTSDGFEELSVIPVRFQEIDRRGPKEPQEGEG